MTSLQLITATFLVVVFITISTTTTASSRIQNSGPFFKLGAASPGVLGGPQQSRQQGYIDVQIMLADFGSLQAEAYMIVCLIANGTAEPPLPITNYKTTCDQVCSGPQSPLTNHPVWQVSCLPPKHQTTFPEDRARTALEIWDSWGNGTEKKRFLGGNSITVADLLRGGLNGTPWQFGLFGGDSVGYGVVRINWTPKGEMMNNKKRRMVKIGRGYY